MRKARTVYFLKSYLWWFLVFVYTYWNIMISINNVDICPFQKIMWDIRAGTEDTWKHWRHLEWNLICIYVCCMSKLWLYLMYICQIVSRIKTGLNLLVKQFTIGWSSKSMLGVACSYCIKTKGDFQISACKV